MYLSNNSGSLLKFLKLRAPHKKVCPPLDIGKIQFEVKAKSCLNNTIVAGATQAPTTATVAATAPRGRPGARRPGPPAHHAPHAPRQPGPQASVAAGNTWMSSNRQLQV